MTFKNWTETRVYFPHVVARCCKSTPRLDVAKDTLLGGRSIWRFPLSKDDRPCATAHQDGRT